MWGKIKSSFVSYPLQSVLIILLIIAVSFIGYKQYNTQSSTSISQQNSTIVLKGLSDRYFIPENSTTTSSAPVTSSSESKVATTTGSKLPNLKLIEGLFNYMANTPVNVTTGIKKTNVVSYNKNVANAANDFLPVVYYSENSSGNCKYVNPCIVTTKIIEVNIFTGERKTIVDEGTTKGIVSVSFNGKNQAIAYSISSDVSRDKVSHEAKIYYLETGKSESILKTDGTIGAIQWSPDNKDIAFGITTYDIAANAFKGNSIYVYDFDKKQGKEFSISNAAIATQDLNWANDSSGVLLSEELMVNVDTTKDSLPFIPVLVNKDDGKIQEYKQDLNQNQVSVYPMLINNKLIAKTRSRDTAVLKDKMDNGGSYSYGWLYVYDLTSNQAHEYKTETGEYLTGWLADKKVDKVVFTKLRDGLKTTALSVLDVSNGQVKSLGNSPKDQLFNIVGWDGNEDNVMVWDNFSTFYNVDVTTGQWTQITQ